MKNSKKNQTRNSKGELILDTTDDTREQIFSGLILAAKVAPVALVLFGCLGWVL